MTLPTKASSPTYKYTTFGDKKEGSDALGRTNGTYTSPLDKYRMALKDNKSWLDKLNYLWLKNIIQYSKKLSY